MSDAEQTDGAGPADLSHAGAVVDKAIEYMAGQNIAALSIASALLGGAISVLTAEVGEAATIRVLENALATVRAGDLRQRG